jgi:hypothetical protein
MERKVEPVLSTVELNEMQAVHETVRERQSLYVWIAAIVRLSVTSGGESLRITRVFPGPAGKCSGRLLPYADIRAPRCGDLAVASHSYPVVPGPDKLRPPSPACCGWPRPRVDPLSAMVRRSSSTCVPVRSI